jgi:hypothetical protein
MGRAARTVLNLLVSVGVLAGDLLHLGHREPGLQPPNVVHPDHGSHFEPPQIVNDRQGVEIAPPPAVPFIPSSDFGLPSILAHYRRRWHTAYYTQPSNTAVIWAEVQKANALAATAPAA